MPATFTIRKTDQGWQNVKAWKQHLESLPVGRYKVSIQPMRKRTLPQNSWLHAILPDIVSGLQNIGYVEIRTVAQAKNFIKALFFKKVYTNGIDTVEVVEATSETDKMDFVSKAEEIIHWCREYLGIDVAPPGEQTTIDYYVSVAEYDGDLKTTIVK